MKITVSNEVILEDVPKDLVNWIDKDLKIDNPDYIKKQRLGKWTGNTPKKLCLYRVDGDKIIVPIGALKNIIAWVRYNNIEVEASEDLADNGTIDYNTKVNLYDYQEDAVKHLLGKGYGILKSKAGSGKTQMGIALACMIGKKTLWLTHTQDLLKQSMDRAIACGVPKELIGTITAGKVNIGKGITFATVQTLSKQDIRLYKYCWDVIIVDECFEGDTLIDTEYGKMKIRDIVPGIKVFTMNEATKKIELNDVEELQIRTPKTLCRITFEDGTEEICTENHPFLTSDGWEKAVDLNDSKVCYMWERDRFGNNEQDAEVRGEERGKKTSLLKRVLIGSKKASQCMDGRKKRNIKTINDCYEQKIRIREDEAKQSYVKTRNERQGINDIKVNEPQAKNTRRKRKRHDKCANSNVRSFKGNECVSRVCSSNEKTFRRLSYLLQNRCCNSREDDCNRSRWRKSLFYKSSKCRQEETKIFRRVRVESVEIFKQTSDGTFGGMCSEGKVYNLSVKNNHNYFANGVLVHNCHRVAGTPTSMTQFSKVINGLAARYKYGLSATIHRADGLIKSTYMLLGDVAHEVPDSAIADKVMQVRVKRVDTGLDEIPENALDTDGTIKYSTLISELCEIESRNKVIADVIASDPEHYHLILSDRLSQLDKIMDMLPEDLREQCVLINGKMTSKKAKAEREQAIEDMKAGKKHFLFASYKLAKEGLDVPRLDRLHLATPQKDYAVITQCVGRVARTFEGKAEPICYDYVDNVRMFENMWRKRRTSYRKSDCIVEGE